MQEAI